MPKVDLKAFEALGQMIKPPPPPKAHKEDDDWMPNLNPAQWNLFFSEKRYILCWAEKFSGKCRTGDTMVYTGDGLKRLGDMMPVGARPGLNPINEPVLAFDGQKVVHAQARHFWVEESRNAIRCVLASGAELTGSPRHPLWVCEQKPNGAFGFRYASLVEMEIAKRNGHRFWTPFVGHTHWKSEKYVSVEIETKWTECKICGDTVSARGLCHKHYANLVDRHKGHHPTRDALNLRITENVGYALGALVGDGMLNIAKAGRQATFANLDAECIDRVKRGLAEAGITVRHVGGCEHKIFPGGRIRSLVSRLGLAALCYYKRIPSQIIESPKSVVAAFLRGLFDTDGWVEKSGYVGFCTTSEALGRDVQDILAAFGILCVRRPKKSASGRPTWTLFITGRHAISFGEQIGFEIARKRDRIRRPRISSTRPWGFSHFTYGYPECIKSVVRVAWREAKISKTRDECNRHKRLCSFGSIPSREKVKTVIETFGSADLFTPFLVSDNWLEVESLTPCEAELFDLSVPGPDSFLASGTINHNTIACLHKVMKHCYENRNALAILLTRTGNMSKDGGSWHKLVTDVLPQWEDGLGLKFKIGTDKQHNTFVWVQNQFNEWSMIMDTSAPHPEQLRERFRGREPSIVFVDELTSCNSDEYFKAIAAQLGRRPMVESVQQYIAATNPDDPDHWVYKLWFGDGEAGSEPGPDYQNIYFPAQENVRNVGEDYFKGLSEVYRGDDAGAAWMIRGEWVARPSGDGLFRNIYQTEIHVRPLTDEGKVHPQRWLQCHPEHPMIIGLDPGSVYNAFVFQQWLPMDGKNKWVIFDELITIKKRISYEAFIPMVMRRMRWWRDECGAEVPFVWISDSSAFNQYRAANGSFDVLEIERIYEANRAQYRLEPLKIKSAPKFNGSVVARTRLAQKMLADQEVIVSSWCRFTQKMFQMLESKRPKAGEPIDPEAILTPQRSDYIHCFDAVSYPWLAASLSPTAVIPISTKGQSLISAAA